MAVPSGQTDKAHSHSQHGDKNVSRDRYPELAGSTGVDTEDRGELEPEVETWVESLGTSTPIFTESPKPKPPQKTHCCTKKTPGGTEDKTRSAGLMVANGPAGHFLSCSQTKRDKNAHP